MTFVLLLGLVLVGCGFCVGYLVGSGKGRA